MRYPPSEKLEIIRLVEQAHLPVRGTGGGILQSPRHRRAMDQGRKNAINWTRLSCRKFRNNAVWLQLHALAYNLGNFMRTLALPKEVEH